MMALMDNSKKKYITSSKKFVLTKCIDFELTNMGNH